MTITKFPLNDTILKTSTKPPIMQAMGSKKE